MRILISFVFLLVSLATAYAQTVNLTGNQSIQGFKRFNTGLFFGVDSGAMLPLGADKPYTRFGIVYDPETNPEVAGFTPTAYTFNDQGMITLVAYNGAGGEPRLALNKLRGTLSNPQSVQTGDVLGRLLFAPYNTSKYSHSVSLMTVMTGTTDNLYTNANLTFNLRKNGNNNGDFLDTFLELNPNGNIYLPQVPPNVLGNYDFLTRNGQTGAIEKLSSSAIVHRGGTESITGDKYFNGRIFASSVNSGYPDFNKMLVGNSNNLNSGGSGYAFGHKNVMNNSSEATAVGYENNVSGTKNFAYGRKNTVAGTEISGAFGYQNTLNQDVNKSFAFGSDNTISSAYAFAMGRTNTVSGMYALAAGRSNTASGHSASALGVYNSAIQDKALAVGYQNEASNSAVAIGFTNVAGASASAIGYRNTAGGSNSFAFGRENQSSASNSGSIGRLNQATAEYAMAIGFNLVNNVSRSIKIGPSNTSYLIINNSGNVGIGVADPGSSKLAVNGNIKAKAVKVDPSTWPDYVFESSYHLPSLTETEQFINKNKHLPGVPSAKEVEEKGIDLGDISAILLKKIEELTLHQIELEKRIKEQAELIVELRRGVRED